MPLGYTVIKKSKIQPDDAFAEARRRAAECEVPHEEIAAAWERYREQRAFEIARKQAEPSMVEKVQYKAAAVKHKLSQPMFYVHVQSPVVVKVQKPVHVTWGW